MNNREIENRLHNIENLIIEKMAKIADVQPFQMQSMIKRHPELKGLYHRVRQEVIHQMAA